MATIIQRINDLLKPHVGSPGDGSLFDGALQQRFPDAPVPRTEGALAYLRVEILLAAWEELHRERADLERQVNDLAYRLSRPWWRRGR